MKNKHSADLMGKLAFRASNDIFFLGNIIAEFKALNKLSYLDMSDFLKCTPDALKRLALCRLPDDRDERFRDDINRISGYVKCNADKLIALIRQVNTLRTLCGESAKHAASILLMAARDRRSEKQAGRKNKKSSKDEDETT